MIVACRIRKKLPLLYCGNLYFCVDNERYDSGGAARTCVVRDSTAEAHPRKHKANETKKNVQCKRCIAPSKQPRMKSRGVTSEVHGNSRKRKACTLQPSSTKAVVRSREKAADQLSLDRWLTTRKLAPSSGPSAQERVAALKSRLQLKV